MFFIGQMIPLTLTCLMSEERLQSEIIKYIKLQYPKVRYCASLGGIYTGPRQAIKAKRTGYSRGFPDLQFTATEVQKEWIKDLQERGYKAEICKGLPPILDLIDWYFETDK